MLTCKPWVLRNRFVTLELKTLFIISIWQLHTNSFCLQKYSIARHRINRYASSHFIFSTKTNLYSFLEKIMNRLWGGYTPLATDQTRAVVTGVETY